MTERYLYGNPLTVYCECVSSQDATIIVYKNRPGTPNRELKRFCNQLYGYIDQSNKGTYTYHRKGILGEIPHIHIDNVRSVIITRTQDAPRIIELLEEFGAYVYSRGVILNQADWDKFTLKEPGPEGGQDGQNTHHGDQRNLHRKRQDAEDAETNTQEDQ